MVISDQFGLISNTPQWQSGGCHRYSLIHHGYYYESIFGIDFHIRICVYVYSYKFIFK